MSKKSTKKSSRLTPTERAEREALEFTENCETASTAIASMRAATQDAATLRLTDAEMAEAVLLCNTAVAALGAIAYTLVVELRSRAEDRAKAVLGSPF